MEIESPAGNLHADIEESSPHGVSSQATNEIVRKLAEKSRNIYMKTRCAMAVCPLHGALYLGDICAFADVWVACRI